MPDLGARGMPAFEELALDDNAAAYARAQRDEHGIFIIFPRAAKTFAERRRVRIVKDVRFQPRRLFHRLCERRVVPAQIIAVYDDAVLAVDRAGRTDARRLDLDARAFAQRFDDRRRVARNVVTRIAVRGNFIFGDNFALFGNDAALDERAAQIQPCVIFHFSPSVFCFLDFFA